MRFPDLGPTLRRWDQEQANLDQQPYMLVRSPLRDADYHVTRRGDRTRADVRQYTGSVPELGMAGYALPLAKGLRLLRTPTAEDAEAIARAEDAMRAARAALYDLARDAWFRGSPVTLEELTAAAETVYGPKP
jgi:hypothetical protein